MIDYLQKHVERGACTCGKCADAPDNPEEKQPEGHTVDMIFFKVANKDAEKEEFLKLVQEKFPHWLDGNEHSYYETGGDIGDQGLALMAMGLGKILGIWEVMTPLTMIPDIDEALAQQMAGAGMISIQYREAS